ncbi:tetratricopeptide repeat protein [Asticcacaulis solisilvae]|uniref:tetratricopeptide repeat protein n=1 Tax=Asticcacaulis solisilvae TaxID=1217274 RepID=UPI003FD84D78
MREAVGFHQQGRLDQAMALYRKVLDLRPRDAEVLRLMGTAACQGGRPDHGAALLEQSLDLSPDQPDVSHNLGHALQSLGRYDAALMRYDRALALRPGYASAWFSRGNALMNLGRLEAAIESYDRAVALKPDYAEAWLHRGNAQMDLDRLPEALASYDRALAIAPGFTEAWINRSDVLMNLARPAEALDGYDRILRAQPGMAYIWSNRGTALVALKRCTEALDSYEHALRLDPGLADAHSNRGNALQRLGRNEEAIEACQAALKLRPDFARALNIRGNAETALRRFEDALASYDRALVLQPGYAEALGNRGGALMNLKRFADAIASCDQSLAIMPDSAETHNNRGSALLGLERFGEALAEFDHALRLAPDIVEAHSNRGNALQGLNRFGEAVVCYDQAIALDAAYVQAWTNRGNAFQFMDRFEDANASYRRTLELKPDAAWVPGQILHNQLLVADWEGLEDGLADLVERLRKGDTVATPFLLHSLIDAPDLHRRAARDFLAERYLPRDDLPPLVPPPAHARIRLAYVSADFGEHPVTYLMAGVLEHHDRARFEVYAISLTREGDAGWRERVVAAVDHFIDVSDKTDAQVTALMRELEIDIAIDLNGYTKGCRTAVFAGRAAPVQVNYIGFLGTMAADYIDYVIADPVILPLAAAPDYAEKIVHLPVFQVNDDRQADPAPAPSRKAAGLPEDAFVFCCFNMVYKIAPDVFAIWMRILKRVPGSVLWLYAKSESVKANMKAHAERHGVDPGRILFAPRVPLAEHLARQKSADLFLDTFPYNAGATASSALKAGLPVLTRMGRSYASRMGASLLTAAGMPDLIAASPQAYEDLAVALATDPAQLQSVRRRLAEGLVAGGLFDTARATRAMESAYIAMHRRYSDGLPPDHISLTPAEAG